MSIGFSDDHDAAFMNKLAQAGSEVGNFIYIRSESETKKQDILDALNESLEIALEGQSGQKLEVRSRESGSSETFKLSSVDAS